MDTLLSAFRDFLRELLKEFLPEILANSKPDEKAEQSAYTREQFCKAHGNISLSSWRKMRREGWAPDIMLFGTQHMVSRESAQKWRRDREAEAKSDAAILEHERLVAHGKIIGAKAAASPLHVSKRGKRRKKAKEKR
jgi:hypothetical protein